MKFNFLKKYYQKAKHTYELFLNSERYERALLRLRKKRLSKGQVPLLKVLQTLYAKLVRTNVHEQASGVAFAFLLSLFPAILFLFSLIPFITDNLQIANAPQQVQTLLKEVIPLGIYDFVAPTIKDILLNKRGDVLSFGFLFALYAATSGVVELMNTFNKNYEYSEKRSFWKKRLIAMMLAFLFALLLIIAVGIIIIGQLVLHLVAEFDLPQGYDVFKEDFVFYSIAFFRYIIAFLVFYIGISFVYYIAPATSGHWRFFSYGSTSASILIILSTYGFSYYLSHFATYNKLYGSIGTLIALMIWLYLLAWILLLGFTLNACIDEAKVEYKKELEQRYQLLDDLGE